MRLGAAHFNAYHIRQVATTAVLVCCIAIPAFAWQNNQDSLLRLLNARHVQDTVTLDLLNKLSFASVSSNQEKGIFYADQAIVLAVKLHLPLREAEGYLNKGINLAYRSDSKKATEVELIALKIFERAAYKTGITRANIELSRAFYNMGNYARALQYAQLSVYQARELQNQVLLISALNKLGNCLMLMSDYPRAIDNFFQILKICEKSGDKLNTAKALGNIGLIYYYLKKYPESLKYSNKGLETLENMHDMLWVGAALNNIGAIYYDTRNYLQVIAYNKRALAINRQLGSRKGIANDMMDIGAAYAKMRSYTSAWHYLQRSADIYKRLNAKYNLATAYGHLAILLNNAPDSALIRMNINPNKRFSAALLYQQQAVHLARQTKSLSTEADQWENLSIIYEKQGNFKEAFKSYKNYEELKDSIASDKKRNEVTRLGIQYEFDKKEAVLRADNARRQVELSRQKVIKNASILIGTVLFLSAVTTFIFYKRRKDAQVKQKEAEFKVQVAETEMKVLRAQLNPHFIFNSLNSIGDYIARHDKETADVYLSKFARLMRMILENSEYETISLADDLKVLELYIQLESMRMLHKLIYTIQIDKDIDAELIQVPPMLMQPFVENSIWHGISPKNDNGRIDIRVKKNGDMIEYMLEDDGIGRQKSSELKKNRLAPGRRSSFGIKIIQSRISIINESKRADAKVELTDLDGGTKVSIKLPHDIKF